MTESPPTSSSSGSTGATPSKKFDADKKVPADVWSALEQSLLLAPSSFGLQPWKFLVVEDRELRQQLRGARGAKRR